MDTNRLKSFAQRTRVELMGQVARRLEAALAEDSAERREAPAAMKALEDRIAREGERQVIEQVAYTWFNRFTALRYMDANGYLTPMVVTPAPDRTRPELLDQAAAGALPDHLRAPVADRVRDLLEGRAPAREPQVEAYRLLVVATCNHLGGVMPFLFEQIADYTELLMPNELLAADGWVAEMRSVMTEEACQDVEIIGWLYQFYISEKKDQVFAGLKRNQKITAENIPAATQLFTPHWIVRYLVENSLGRLWLLNRPGSRLAERMEYYIAPEEPETDFLRVTSPEEIRVCDPACGSGHMLTYAFDLLYAIYEEEGYDPVQIPELILRNNLTGIEIDDRAGALAAFALAMKAAARIGRRRFLRMEVRPDVVVLENVQLPLSEFNDLLYTLGYDLNVDQIAGGLKTVPLALTGLWSQVSSYLKRAEGPGFEDAVEEAVTVFASGLADEIGFFDEAANNPFLVNQLKELRSALVAIAEKDSKQRDRTALEREFGKRTGSPRLADRVTRIGSDYRSHKNDTTYRMDLDALLDRVEEAVRHPEALTKLKGIEDGLKAAVDFHAPLWATVLQFGQAKNFGSLIVPKVADAAGVLVEVRTADLSGDMMLTGTRDRVTAVLRTAEALAPRYHVVVANPPYAGAKGLNADLKGWLERTYPSAKSDMMTAFMVRASVLCINKGIWGMINLPSWMFLSSFKECREWLLSNQTIHSLLQLGRGIFGSDFGSTAFVIKNAPDDGSSVGLYRRLFEKHVQVRRPEEIEELFFDRTYGEFSFLQADLKKIPGYPIAYWITEAFAQAFETAPPFSENITLRAGLSTGHNPTFQRYWHEVSGDKFDTQRAPGTISEHKWFPCNSGGDFRKWFGNHDVVLNWESDGQAIKSFGSDSGRIRSAVRNEDYYFREGITWSKVSSGSFAARFRPAGFIFDDTGRCGFTDDSNVLMGGLGMFCSKVTDKMLEVLCPTMSFTSTELGVIPLDPAQVASSNARIVSELVKLGKSDWDAYETSWDFTTLPLLSPDHRSGTLEATYTRLRAHWAGMTAEMQRLEEENNRIFIDAYGLQDELTPEVPIEEITLTCNPAYRYGVKGTEEDRETRLLADTMREFISYAIGCMFGRYSLDEPGLILANQGDTIQTYLDRIPEPSFMPDRDNVIPLFEEDWFEDDAYQRFREFLSLTFGEDRLVENLEFMRQALGKEVRAYLAKDFYADHVQRYKKRPIYWLVSSPKGAFQALIYMHRYTPDTLNITLNDYVRALRDKLEAGMRAAKALEINPDASATEKNRAKRDIDRFTKQIAEVTEWERDLLYPLAVERIRIDLDDGVKANYPKFPGVLKPIKGLEAKDA